MEETNYQIIPTFRFNFALVKSLLPTSPSFLFSRQSFLFNYPLIKVIIRGGKTCNAVTRALLFSSPFPLAVVHHYATSAVTHLRPSTAHKYSEKTLSIQGRDVGGFALCRGILLARDSHSGTSSPRSLPLGSSPLEGNTKRSQVEGLEWKWHKRTTASLVIHLSFTISTSFRLGFRLFENKHVTFLFGSVLLALTRLRQRTLK